MKLKSFKVSLIFPQFWQREAAALSKGSCRKWFVLQNSVFSHLAFPYVTEMMICPLSLELFTMSFSCCATHTHSHTHTSSLLFSFSLKHKVNLKWEAAQAEMAEREGIVRKTFPRTFECTPFDPVYLSVTVTKVPPLPPFQTAFKSVAWDRWRELRESDKRLWEFVWDSDRASEVNLCPLTLKVGLAPGSSAS